MYEQLTEAEITKKDLEELSLEELADLKVSLEELSMKCEELLEDDE